MADTNDAPNDPGAADAPKDDAAKAPTTPPAENVEPPEDYAALAKKWEKQAKNDAASLAALKKRMQGLLTPEQVESEKQAAQNAGKDAAEARKEALRLRVALRMELPEAWADRLIGDTEEDLVKDAETLKSQMKPATTLPKSRVPDAGAGTGKTPSNNPDPNALLRAAMGLG